MFLVNYLFYFLFHILLEFEIEYLVEAAQLYFIFSVKKSNEPNYYYLAIKCATASTKALSTLVFCNTLYIKITNK